MFFVIARYKNEVNREADKLFLSFFYDFTQAVG